MIIFRLSLLLPILICLYILISLFKSNGNILSGFNTLDEEKTGIDKTWSYTYFLT